MASPPIDMDKFLAELGDLPAKIQENLKKLENIDLQSRDLVRNITQQTDDYLKNKKYLTDKNNKALNSIQRQFAEAKKYGDDKVQLSVQSYSAVDDHIKKMDEYFKWYESNLQPDATNIAKTIQEDLQKKKFNKTENNDIKKNQLDKGAKKTSTASEKAKLDVNIPKNFPKSGVVGALVGKGVVRTAPVIDMPVDPNEPKFCLCNQVSFGEMIGCDNPDCTIEWFHFVCVNLTTKPEGKWFCPKCKEPKEKQ